MAKGLTLYRGAVERVLERFPVASADAVLHMVAVGDAQMFAFDNHSVAITRLVKEPNRLVCLIWLASGDIDGLLNVHDQIEEWALAQGCSHLRIVGRKGWLKVLDGYAETAVEMEKDIRREQG